jgi:hypothetical protein
MVIAEMNKPNYEKTIVCLASSRKPGGRCIAGKEIDDAGNGSWIRPVSVRIGGEIQFGERQYENGNEPQLLDVIGIPMMAPVPRLHQTENHAIDAGFYWRKKRVFAWDELESLKDSPKTLWVNGSSTQLGCNDRISESDASGLKHSLLLIKPKDVTLEVIPANPNFRDSKKKIRADFSFKGVRYNLMVTDPNAETIFFDRPSGAHSIDSIVYFCISLAESPFEGHYYKLVAAVIAEKPL